MPIINGVGRVGIRQTISTPSTPSIITSGLILNLDAGNPASYPGTGTTWTDLSGNNRNGTLVNGTSYSSANGGTMVLDGVNDYIDLGSNLNLTKLTFTCWIKTSGTPGHLIGAYLTSPPYLGWGVSIGFDPYDGKTINFWSGNGWKDSGIQCNTNTWICITVTFENNTVSFYKNGSFVNSTSSGTLSPYNGNVRLGSRADGLTTYNGSIAQTLIYDKPLTPTEITNNFNATKTRFGL